MGLTLAAALVGAAVCASPSLAAVRWFHSPTRNIECEVASGDPALGTYALCQTLRPQRSVTLHGNGTATACTGIRCMSNGPLNAFTLRYGRSVRVGPFTCTSLTTGMRCLVARSGHGFLISRESLRRF